MINISQLTHDFLTIGTALNGQWERKETKDYVWVILGQIVFMEGDKFKFPYDVVAWHDIGDTCHWGILGKPGTFTPTHTDPYTPEEIDALIAAERQARMDADAQLHALISGIIGDYATKEYVDGRVSEISTRIDGIASRIDGLSSRVDGVESQITAINGTLASIQSHLSEIDNTIEGIGNRLDDIDTTLSAIESSIDSIESSIDGINNRLDSIESALETINTTLSTLDAKIDAEIARAEASESALGTRIDGVENDVEALDTRLTTAEGDIDTLESWLSAETEARESADSTLQTNIDNEATAREAADTQLQSNIDAEIARAEAAESALDTRLTTAESDIDSLESSVDALYNTEVEGTTNETSVSSSTSGKVKTFVVGLASAIKTKIEAAYSHISDAVKHITATERSEWGTAYTHSQTSGNPHGTTIEEIDGLRTELTTIESDVSAIEGVIPSEATPSNQLADKSFVNSSVTTNTATFRGTSAKNLTEAQFLAWANTLTKTKNDYCFWDTTDSDGNVVFKRYKWNDVQWEYEYTLNNSSFTASQWAAIQSGITAEDVADIGYNTTARHTHANKNLLDTYTQTNANIADAVTKKHTHENKTVLDNISSSDVSSWNAKATSTDITNAINALDVSDTSVANQFVTKVSETDGKISVSRAQPQISDVKDLQTTLNSKAADSNVVHKTGDETILGIKSFGGGIEISDTGNRNFKCCRYITPSNYNTSNTNPLPAIASAGVNTVYNIGSTDSQAIAAGYIAGHRYSKLSSTAESYTDVTTGYCKRARIRLNARNTSSTITGTLKILLTSFYGSGNNFGSISWNWNGAVPNNATRTTGYMSYTWCDWAAYYVSNDWRIFGPCWDSQEEGWYIEIINKGALNANTNGAVLYIESYGNSSTSINPLYYATLNDDNILTANSVRLEIIPTPTTISQLRNGAWEDVNVSTYRHIPEVPDSKNNNKVRELFHTGSTIPIANGGTGNTTGKATDSDKLGGQLPSYYATKSEIPDVSGKENTSNKVTTLDNSTTHYPSTSAVTTALNGKQDSISDIATIRSNAANGQTAYGWGNHADAGYLTDEDLSGYLKTKNLYSISAIYGVKFATTTVTTASSTSYATYLFSRLQIGIPIGSLSASNDKPLSGFVQIFQRTNNSAVTTTVTARITVFQADYTGNIRVFYKINGQNVDWYIATTNTRQYCAWRMTEVNAYETVTSLNLVALTSLDGLTEINASYKTPLVDASSTGIGSSANPVYVSQSGQVTACGFSVKIVSAIPSPLDANTLYVV